MSTRPTWQFRDLALRKIRVVLTDIRAAWPAWVDLYTEGGKIQLPGGAKDEAAQAKYGS
jgi:hypothetical protein